MRPGCRLGSAPFLRLPPAPRAGRASGWAQRPRRERCRYAGRGWLPADRLPASASDAPGSRRAACSEELHSEARDAEMGGLGSNVSSPFATVLDLAGAPRLVRVVFDPVDVGVHAEA